MSLTPLEEVRFALQVLEDSRRVVVCSAHDQLACELATADFPLVEVQVSPLLDPGTVYILDPNGIDASLREALQRETPAMWAYPAPAYFDPWRIYAWSYRPMTIPPFIAGT